MFCDNFRKKWVILVIFSKKIQFFNSLFNNSHNKYILIFNVNLDILIFCKVFNKVFGNLRNFLYICENLPKISELRLMMGYNIMLHRETKTDSFANNNTITTYIVFTSILGNERVSDS